MWKNGSPFVCIFSLISNHIYIFNGMNQKNENKIVEQDHKILKTHGRNGSHSKVDDMA